MQHNRSFGLTFHRQRRNNTATSCRVTTIFNFWNNFISSSGRTYKLQVSHSFWYLRLSFVARLNSLLTIAPIFSHLSSSYTTVHRFCDTDAFIRKAGSLRVAVYPPRAVRFSGPRRWPPPVVLIGNFIVTLGLCELRFCMMKETRDAAMCGNARVTGSH